jgi:hypothetical protein
MDSTIAQDITIGKLKVIYDPAPDDVRVLFTEYCILENIVYKYLFSKTAINLSIREMCTIM